MAFGQPCKRVQALGTKGRADSRNAYSDYGYALREPSWASWPFRLYNSPQRASRYNRFFVRLRHVRPSSPELGNLSTTGRSGCASYGVEAVEWPGNKMEENGVVSLWLGEAESEDLFWCSLDVAFSDDGDFLGSSFSRAFGVDYYDDALREAEYVGERAASLRSLLAQASYGDTIDFRFEMAAIELGKQANCLVLLFDYRHRPPPAEAVVPGVRFRFAGVVPYV